MAPTSAYGLPDIRAQRLSAEDYKENFFGMLTRL
jgi:hypothetical protein